MAGENVLPLTRSGMVTLLWTVPNNRAYDKGDILEIGETLYGKQNPASQSDTHPFLLADVPARSRGTKVEVCVACDLVQVTKNATEAWVAGTHITWDVSHANGPLTIDSDTALNQIKVGQFIGVVYEDAAADDTTAYLIYRGAWI